MKSSINLGIETCYKFDLPHNGILLLRPPTYRASVLARTFSCPAKRGFEPMMASPRSQVVNLLPSSTASISARLSSRSDRRVFAADIWSSLTEGLLVYKLDMLHFM
jgi:hypothetical protein